VNSSDLLAFFGVLGRELPDSPRSDLFQRFGLICASLGNGELLVKECREMTERNAVEVLLLKSECDLDICDHIKFIASHFDSVLGKDRLSKRLLIALLESPSLRIHDEDSLFAYVGGLVDEDASNCDLLASIRCEFLGESSLSQYISLIDRFGDELYALVWPHLRDFLLHVPHNSGDLIDIDRYGRPGTIIQKMEYAGQPFEGILRYLTNKYGGNVCKKGIVDVTARETDHVSYGGHINGGSPRAVVDLDTQLSWYDCNRGPSWLQLDFKTRRISISSYTIKFGYCSGNYGQTWRLEVSNDGAAWVTIDSREAEVANHADYSVQHYTCNTGSSDMFQYARVLYTDDCWGGDYGLGMTSIEFFGVLRSEQR
jgi:hypothetical protein